MNKKQKIGIFLMILVGAMILIPTTLYVVMQPRYETFLSDMEEVYEDCIPIIYCRLGSDVKCLTWDRYNHRQVTYDHETSLGILDGAADYGILISYVNQNDPMPNLKQANFNDCSN